MHPPPKVEGAADFGKGMTMGLALILTIFAALCLAIQWAGIFLALAALWRKPAGGPAVLPPVSVLRPICGIENFLDETLESTFAADYPTYELIFCAADPADPAVALVQKLMARHPAVPARVLTGDDKVSGNPKLNNLIKGWNAARYDHILMSDSNVILPPDALRRCMAEFTPQTGLVSSPPPCSPPPAQGMHSARACLSCRGVSQNAGHASRYRRRRAPAPQEPPASRAPPLTHRHPGQPRQFCPPFCWASCSP